MKIRVCLLLLAALVAACGSSSPSSPSSTTTSTTTIADPSITESWTSTVPVGGARFFSFTIAQYGTVNVTLNSIGGAFVPATVTVSLGIGQPSGTDCSTTTSSDITAQTTAPQVTGTMGPGVYCARIADVGNLFAPADFSVTVAHP